MAKQELNELRSALTELTLTIQTANGVSGETITAKAEEIAASREAAAADKQEAAASKGAAASVGSAFMKLAGSAVGTVNAFYGLAKVIASIGEAGRKFAETTGTTASQGAQFQLDLIRTLKADTKKFSVDQQATAAQIRGAATSFAEVFVGAADGMRISAEGSAAFARSLNTGFKSEFQLTAQSMKALITVGASTTKEFEAFRKASGRAGLSSGQFANLVNKNSLSFMLYGPSFAKAAVNAERLGISLSSVQKAQESMVTNLSGTIDTVAQINQLGGQIDFGTLTTLAETQGPEAVLSYLQSTIPPALFQSASTRALLSGLGIPLEDLMKRQGSVQDSTASKIEKAMTTVGKPASDAAKSIAELNKKIQAIDESKVMEMMNAAYGAATALIGLIGALGGFAIALAKASMQLLKFPGGIPGTPKLSNKYGVPGGLPGPALPPGGLPGPVKAPGFMSRMGSFLADPFKAAFGAGGAAPRVGAAAGKVAGGVRSVAGGVGKGVATSVGRMGAFGVGAGILSVGTGAMDAYRSAREAGKSKEEAAGNAAIQGGTAAIGTILGGFFGPAGAAIGGMIGNWFGSKINEWFPFGKSIGETFGKMKEAAMPLIEKLKEFWGIIKGPLMLSLKVIGAIIGGVIVANFKILGFVFSKVIAPVLGFVIDILKVIGRAWVSMLNVIIDAINYVLPDTLEIKKLTVPEAGSEAAPSTGDDVISKSGYGSRSLVTPGGTIALNNNDTVIAYADDLTAGIKKYSLGTLSRTFNSGVGEEVKELISMLRNANTTIQVDNKIQQVPRLALANVGVYTRNERV